MIDLSNRELTRYEVPANVKQISLRHNQLTNLVDLPEQLQQLDVSHNKIAMLDSLCPNNRLQVLNLSYNRLISIEGATALLNLQVLDISHNFLSPSQLEYLQDLKKLSTLNLSHNYLTSEDSLVPISRLQALVELDLSFNDFQLWQISLPMMNLKTLNLDNNKIKTLNLMNLQALEKLSCVENCVNEIIELAGAQTLQELKADGNELNEIPSLAKVKILSLSHNRLSILPHFASLEVLNVSHNSLHSIYKVSLNLAELTASHNLLTSLPFGMKNLEILDITSNKFSRLDFISSCSKLKVLKAAFNLFSNPLDLLSRLLESQIIELDFSGLRMNKETIDKYISQLPLLEKLNQKTIAIRRRSELLMTRADSEEPAEILHKSQRSEPDPKSSKDPLDPEEIKTYLPPAKTSNAASQAFSHKLTPSKTESFSILPSNRVSLTSRPNSLEIDDKRYLAFSIKDIYRSVMRNIRSTVSHSFSKLAKSNSINTDFSHYLHKKKRTKQRSIQTEIPTSPLSIGQHLRPPSVISQGGYSYQTSHLISLDKDQSSLPVASPAFSPINGKQFQFIDKNLIIKYAQMPPRPILRSESQSSIVTQLSQSTECVELAEYFMLAGFKTETVYKTYNFSLHKDRHYSDLMFYYAKDEELQELLTSSTGFKQPGTLLHSQLLADLSYVLVCLSNLSELKKVFKSNYQTQSSTAAIPAYLVYYS